MELSPHEGRGHLIEAYGDGRFRVAGLVVAGSILIGPHGIESWPVASVESESADSLYESLAPLIAGETLPEILLVGCGARGQLLPARLRTSLKKKGISVESMDTGAACRTYNVLVAEDRLVAAALIAV